MSEAELNRAAITDEDVDGYRVERSVAHSAASSSTTDPAECAPIAQAIGMSGSAYAAKARVGRMVNEDDGPGAVMSLASHTGQDAGRVVDAVRTAAERCRTFLDESTDFSYEAVEVQSDPGYGDESVSLRLTQLVPDDEDEAIKVPYSLVVARKGTTVAMFYSFNRPTESQGEKPAGIPDAVVRAQMEKIG